MDPNKQLSEFKEIDFKYELEYYNALFFTTYCVKFDGYNMKHILSCLRKGEVITFFINNGSMVTGNPFDDTYRRDIYEEYVESIYWYHEFYGDTIRIKTNYPDFNEYLRHAIKLIIRKEKIEKIKNSINGNK